MNRLFKKTLSLMLVIVMTVSLGVSAAAADQTGAAQAEGPLGIVSAMSVELNALVEATKISKTEEIAGKTTAPRPTAALSGTARPAAIRRPA